MWHTIEAASVALISGLGIKALPANGKTIQQRVNTAAKTVQCRFRELVELKALQPLTFECKIMPMQSILGLYLLFSPFLYHFGHSGPPLDRSCQLGAHAVVLSCMVKMCCSLFQVSGVFPMSRAQVSTSLRNIW